MRLTLTRGVNLASLLHGGNSKQDGQEVLKHPDSDDHGMEEEKKSASGANEQKEEDEVETVLLARCVLAMKSLPPTLSKKQIFLRLGFSQTVTQKLMDDQWIDYPWTLASLSDEDIAAIFDMIKRTDDLVSSKTPNRGNLMFILAART